MKSENCMHVAYGIQIPASVYLVCIKNNSHNKNVGEEKILLINNLGLWHFFGAHNTLQTQRLTFSSIPHAIVYLTAASASPAISLYTKCFFFRFFHFSSCCQMRKNKRGSIIHRNHAIIYFCVKKIDKICSRAIHGSRKSSKIIY